MSAREAALARAVALEMRDVESRRRPHHRFHVSAYHAASADVLRLLPARDFDGVTAGTAAVRAGDVKALHPPRSGTALVHPAAHAAFSSVVRSCRPIHSATGATTPLPQQR